MAVIFKSLFSSRNGSAAGAGNRGPASCPATRPKLASLARPAGAPAETKSRRRMAALLVKNWVAAVPHSELISLVAEDRRGDSPQVPAKNLQPLLVRQVGVEHLRQLGRIGARRTVAAPNQPVRAQLAHGKVHLAGMRVGPAELDIDVFVTPHGPHAQFPVAAGMAADQRHFGKPRG